MSSTLENPVGSFKVEKAEHAMFSKTGINFNKRETRSENHSLESINKSGKKKITIKAIKFPKKNLVNTQLNSSAQPKPPLHKKNLANTFETAIGVTTTEALLKMADEGLATIEMELNQ